jgi:hypothetical protein
MKAIRARKKDVTAEDVIAAVDLHNVDPAWYNSRQQQAAFEPLFCGLR